MRDKLISILEKRVDFGDYYGYKYNVYEYIDFYNLNEVEDIINYYELYGVLITGGQVLEEKNNEWKFIDYYSYTGKDIKESIKIARKAIFNLKKDKKYKSSNIVVELGGVYENRMLTNLLDGFNFVKANGITEFSTNNTFLYEVKQKNYFLFKKIRKGFTKIDGRDGYYWEYKHALNVVNAYEKHNIIVRGGLPIEVIDNHQLERYDGYWEYSGKDVKESAEIARKMIMEMEDTSNVYMELGEPYSYE